MYLTVLHVIYHKKYGFLRMLYYVFYPLLFGGATAYKSLLFWFRCLSQCFDFAGIPIPHPPAGGDFGIGPEQLASVTRDHNLNALQEYGGASLWK